MQQNQSSNILALMVIVVILAGFDYLLASLLVDFDKNSFPLLIILFPLAIIILVLTFKIWKIILAKEKTPHRTLLLIAAMLTIAAGLTGLFIYSIEIILSSGFLGTAYFELVLTSNQNEIGIAFPLMILTYLLKFLHNIFGLIGCLLTGIVWSWQFRIWARFLEAPFIKSFYFVGVTMIILFLDQIVTIILYYAYYWFNPLSSIGDYPPAFQTILMILFLIAALVLPIYIYFLAIAGQRLRIPYEKIEPQSRIVIILPFIFFFLWVCVYILPLLGGPKVDTLVARFIGACLFVAIFIPISIGFFGWARKVDSAYLKENLYLGAVGTLALSIVSIIAHDQWTGMSILPSYLLAFSVLTWSLANISQFLGSREALSRRLRETGAKFLAELGEAEMKAQSVQQMAKVMAHVSNGFMEDLANMDIGTPPTENEIRRYIVSSVFSMGVEASPSESEIIAYVKDAIRLIEKTDLEN